MTKPGIFYWGHDWAWCFRLGLFHSSSHWRNQHKGTSLEYTQQQTHTPRCNYPIGSQPPTVLDPDLLGRFIQFLATNPGVLSTAMGYSALAASNKSGIPSSVWILDSGATHHMSHNLSCFSSV